MCRILGGILKPRKSPDLVKELIKQFVNASSRDTYLDGRKHGDGWGYAGFGFTEASETPVLLFYKTISPIDSKYSVEVIDALINRIRRFETLYLILHSRLAGSKEPYGENHAHPYFIESKGLNLWFIHNGGVDKFKLTEIIGVNPLLYTDSYIAATYLAKLLNECNELNDECVKTGYDELSKYTLDRSSLNTALLVLTGEKVRLYVTYLPSGEAEYHIYFKLFAYIDDDNVAVFSSTILDYLNRVGRGYGERVKQLEKGIYRLDPLDKLIKIG